jgi:hypothetical protein
MRTRRLITTATALAAVLVLLVPSTATASGSFVGIDKFASRGDPGAIAHVACAYWGLVFDVNANGYNLHIRSANSTYDGGYPTCPNAYGLPAGRSKTRARIYRYDSSIGAYVLYYQSALTSNGSGSASVYTSWAGTPSSATWFYARAGHDVTLFNDSDYFESGWDHEPIYYSPPA